MAVAGKKGEHLVCKLKKSLYGLKQSGRNWNYVLHSYLVNEGFTQSQADNCVYINITKRSFTVIVVRVDDLIIASNCTDKLDNVKKSLGLRFKMKDLGILAWFLGLEFICKIDVIKVNQTQYIKKVLSKFNMENCKPRSTPCEMGAGNLNEGDAEVDNVRLYREIVGSLVYIITAARPDLCYIVTKLSQHLAKPTLVHLNAAKNVLRYLKGTANRNLVFRKSEKGLRWLPIVFNMRNIVD